MSNLRFLRMLRHLIICAMVIMASAKIYAHGGDSLPPAKAEKKTEVRPAASKPETLLGSELSNILRQNVIPDDVLLVRCSLNEFAVCRGVDVTLFDLSGKRLLTGNSGTDGLLGFEGLMPKTKYIAKIESAKYSGDAEVVDGRVSPINADKKE